MPFKYSNLNLRVITIFRISLFFKITKNKNHFAGVMKVTPLRLFFSRVEMVNNEEFDIKVKYPFQLIFVKDNRKFEKSFRPL